jgi:hypothetical protein
MREAVHGLLTRAQHPQPPGATSAAASVQPAAG